MSETMIRFTLNGRDVTIPAATRGHLGDLLREHFRETGTHLGCEHGVCGACNVLMNGRVVRSCLTLAVQLEGVTIETVEHCGQDARFAALQNAFVEHNALQCGFCTSGMLMTAQELLAENPTPDHEEIRDAISGNLCRCTGYQAIVEAISEAAAWLKEPANE